MQFGNQNNIIEWVNKFQQENVFEITSNNNYNSFWESTSNNIIHYHFHNDGFTEVDFQDIEDKTENYICVNENYENENDEIDENEYITEEETTDSEEEFEYI